MMTAKNKSCAYGRPATKEERIRLEKFALDFAVMKREDSAAKADALRDFAANQLALKKQADFDANDDAKVSAAGARERRDGSTDVSDASIRTENGRVKRASKMARTG